MNLEELMNMLGDLPPECLTWPVVVDDNGPVMGVARLQVTDMTEGRPLKQVVVLMGRVGAAEPHKAGEARP